MYEHRQREKAKKREEPGVDLEQEEASPTNDDQEPNQQRPLRGIANFINKHVLLEDFLNEDSPSTDVSLEDNLIIRTDDEDQKYAIMGNQGHSTVPLPQMEYAYQY